MTFVSRDQTDDWIQDIREITKCQDVEQISDEMFNKSGIKKAKLAELLGEVVSLVEKQREMVRDLRTANDLLKTELLESKSAMIKIQSEQLKCNTEQLQSLQTAVKSIVQNTMQSEMKSRSHIVVLSQKSPNMLSSLLKR